MMYNKIKNYYFYHIWSRFQNLKEYHKFLQTTGILPIYVINKKNCLKLEFLEYIEQKEKSIITKIKYLISSKNKAFNDMESLIEARQKEKKNTIINNYFKDKIRQIDK